MSAATEPPDGPSEEPAAPPVGSLAEEAVRLAAALRGAGHDHASSDIREAGDAMPAECAWCPVCRTLRTLRVTDPVVREHLAAAGASLLAAVAAVLAPPEDVVRPAAARGEREDG